MSLKNARLRLSGVTSLEDDLPDAPVEGEGEPVVSAQAEETVDAATAEVTEAADVVESHDESAEKLEEAEATLESIHVRMVQSLESGGMSEREAAAFNIAIAAALRPVGVTADRTGMPSVESFGSATGRLTTTRVSVESVAEWLKKIWVAIKNAVSKMIDAVKNFFAKLFGGVEKLEKRIEELEKKAKEMDDSKVNEKEITFRSVSKLHITGKADVKDFQTGLTNLSVTVGKAFDAAEGTVDYVAKDFAADMKKLAESKDAETANEIHAARQMAVKNAKLADMLTNDDKVLSGGLHVVSPTDGKDGLDKLKMTLEPKQKFAQIDDSAKLVPMKSDAVKAMLGTCKEICVTIKKKKDTIEKLKKKTDDALKSYNEAIDKIEKLDMKWIDKGMMMWYMRGIRNNTGGFLSSLSSHSFASVRAALVLCEKSIAAHGTTKDKKAD